MIKNTFKKRHRQALNLVRLALLISGLTWLMPVQAEHELPNLTLGVLEFPPFSYTDEATGDCTGSAIELTREILASYSLSVEAICAPALRVYSMLESSEIDFTINIKSTPYIQNKVRFSQIPFGLLHIMLVSHERRGFENMVSAIRGFGYHGVRQKMLERGFVFQDTPGSIDAIKMFLRGRTRHLLTYEGPFNYHLARQTDADMRNFTIDPLLTVPTYFAVSQRSPYSDQLIHVFDTHAKLNNLSRFEELLGPTQRPEKSEP
ncbi:substrate-binding periplasmic protein [Alteromonas oceanisediminis]|uniref:substrate-binding periplasmic protein n=1 Tax=Alteromonas oceanisediminis TaxID=2836180 RepID=UPI001BDACF10|nr:transporter substrate-binding domain-containing protein [Alteromonas oceanisediminis]MBT0586730.1 transporter substrate-binding domain-containing protein [Alteromonas oceanisediminis]